jgi:hypothetical protein
MSVTSEPMFEGRHETGFDLTHVQRLGQGAFHGGDLPVGLAAGDDPIEPLKVCGHI